MNTTMLAIRNSCDKDRKCSPNLLPARLNHNGPINETERYWKPEEDEAGRQQAYFRGRHLQGTSLALPTNYTGAVLHITDKDLPESQNGNLEHDAEEEEEAEKVEVKIVENLGSFNEVMIWGHGGAIDINEDLYARGINEWIGFAEAMHVEPEDKENKVD